MQHFSLQNHKKFYRKSIANQIALSAAADFIYMGFLDCNQGVLVDWWSGRGVSDAAEPDPQRILGMIRKIDRAAKETGRCPSDGRTLSFDLNRSNEQEAQINWTQSGDYLIGIGGQIENLLPIIVVLGDRSDSNETRDTFLCIGMSYVKQELHESITYSPGLNSNAVETALSMLSIHFAVVDSYGDIDYSTDLSEGLLNQNGGFDIESKRLIARRPKTQRVFMHALRLSTGPARKPSIVSIEGEEAGDRSKIVVIMPVKKSSPPRALVIFEQGDDDPILLDHLLKLSGLTNSERRITHHILEGKSLAEAAEETNLSLSTVRSYMKGIFSKTSTHRQSELITRYQNAVPRVKYSDIAKPANLTVNRPKH